MADVDGLSICTSCFLCVCACVCVCVFASMSMCVCVCNALLSVTKVICYVKSHVWQQTKKSHAHSNIYSSWTLLKLVMPQNITSVSTDPDYHFLLNIAIIYYWLILSSTHTCTFVGYVTWVIVYTRYIIKKKYGFSSHEKGIWFLFVWF